MLNTFTMFVKVSAFKITTYNNYKKVFSQNKCNYYFIFQIFRGDSIEREF